MGNCEHATAKNLGKERSQIDRKHHDTGRVGIDPPPIGRECIEYQKGQQQHRRSSNDKNVEPIEDARQRKRSKGEKRQRTARMVPRAIEPSASASETSAACAMTQRSEEVISTGRSCARSGSRARSQTP